MEDVKLRYRQDFSLVLRGISVAVSPGERIGIVGRTGSGKSSIFRAILRLCEVDSGRILIDGVDVSMVGLDALRSSISIIPQDPVLFSGTIRFNLDPFNLYSDMKLWSALKKSKLDNLIHSLPNGLQSVISEGEDGFSAGQKQLLCLARALVRESPILLLDEATSSVDYDTDALIQNTIREEFGKGKTTVLTIAHRLRTIIDSDRVLILDAGQVVEFDTPSTLLADPSSRFSQLIAIEQKDSQNISSPSSSSEPSAVASSSSSTAAAKRVKSQLNLTPSVQPILQ